MAMKSGQMVRKTKTNNQKPNMAPPYQEYQNSLYWNKLDQAISDLVKNQDLEEKTPREYIVGYLCKILLTD